MKIKPPFTFETPSRVIGFGKLAHFSSWYLWSANKRMVDIITIRNYWFRVNGKDTVRGKVFYWRTK